MQIQEWLLARETPKLVTRDIIGMILKPSEVSEAYSRTSTWLNDLRKSLVICPKLTPKVCLPEKLPSSLVSSQASRCVALVAYSMHDVP